MYTVLQAIAVRLTLHKADSLFYLCSSVLTLQELDALVDQLPSPYLWVILTVTTHSGEGRNETQKLRELRTLWPAMRIEQWFLYIFASGIWNILCN